MPDDVDESARYPIFDLQGRAILTATALMPGGADGSEPSGITAELGEACHQISAQLGWAGNQAVAGAGDVAAATSR